MEIQESEEETGSTGDKIYDGINFSAMRGEFTIQKLWRERTWKQILGHFFVALVFGALGSFIDIGTDGFAAKSFIHGANYTKRVTNLSDPANHENCVRTGFFTSLDQGLGPKVENEEIVCFEKDLVWGWVTVALMFVPPGFVMAVDSAKAIVEKKLCLEICLRFLLILPSIALFPFVLLVVKLVSLVNPGLEWKKVNARITGYEGSWESSLQMILTLFIISTRADRVPSSIQIASLVASIVMITKTAIANHLSPKQPMKLEDEVKATLGLLPLFLTNGAFKLLSLAVIITCLRGWSFPLYFSVLSVDFAIRQFLNKRNCYGLKPVVEDEPLLHMTTLQLKGVSTATKKDKVESCLRFNIYWGVCHFIVLTSLVVALNFNQDCLNYNPWDFSGSNDTIDSQVDTFLRGNTQQQLFGIGSQRSGLVDNLPLLNGLYIGILASMALNAVLFYLQWWKPAQEEEKEMESEVEQETAVTDSDQQRIGEGKYTQLYLCDILANGDTPHSDGNEGRMHTVETPETNTFKV